MAPGNGEVGEFTVLKRFKDSEDALKLLQSLHQQCLPIMRKHGWGLPCLAEFFPGNPRLLGMNVNAGQKILIRLRPQRNPNSFMDRESLLGTMLHEFSHNVRGPHDKVFWDQLDKLKDELDELLKVGYTGEGFFGKGVRVGQGVSHDKGRTVAESRKIALDTLEKKMRTEKLLGKGGRLGGAVPDMKGKRMSDIMADAAERRLNEAKSCGSSDAHPAGCPRNQLPPEALAEVEKAERESRSVVIDLTRDDDDDDDGDEGYHVVKDEESDPKERVKEKGKARNPNQGQSTASSSKAQPNQDVDEDSDSSIEILSPPPRPRKRLPSPPTTTSNRNFASTKSTRSTSKSATTIAALPPKKPRLPPPPRPSSSVTTWACSTCTFENPSPLALACGACYTERHPFGGDSGTIELDEGWLCSRCQALTEHKFWCCSVCQAVKQSSTRG